MKIKQFLPLLMFAGTMATGSDDLKDTAETGVGESSAVKTVIKLRHDNGNKLNDAFKETYFSMWKVFGAGSSMPEDQKDKLVQAGYDKWQELFKNKADSRVSFLSVWLENVYVGPQEKFVAPDPKYYGEIVFRELKEGDPANLRAGVALKLTYGEPVENLEMAYKFFNAVYPWINKNFPKATKLYVPVPKSGFPGSNTILDATGFKESPIKTPPIDGVELVLFEHATKLVL